MAPYEPVKRRQFMRRAKRHGCVIKELPGTFRGPRGATQIRVLSRTVNGLALTYPLQDNLRDSDIVPRSVVRSICDRLQLPYEEFGLPQDWEIH